MSPRNEDFLFAQEAQRQGYVSEAQVEEGLLLQKRMQEELHIEERLAVILLKRGWLAEEQARQVTARVSPPGARGEIEGYDLIEKIGGGSMGTVYKAMHRGLDRPVAIKILRQDLGKESIHVERLKEEAKLLASLDHPNIVRALDAGESGGFPFVVMEYVEGESLKERIARRGPFREVDALKIIRQTADALERARRMGVVHRDVKPGNIVLSRQGVPKLMDLGLAKGPVDMGLTQHGATVGTPQFISPEQAQDPRRADTRSDIYSLGATLYAMLTGRPPFSGSTLAEVLTKVLYREPAPLRVLNKEVSPDTGYLVERMMLKDPGLRYRTPAEVVHEIDRILAGESILPAGFRGNWEAYLLRRRVKRITRIAVVSLVVLLLAGAGVVFGLRRAEDRRTYAAHVVAVEDALLHTELAKTDGALDVQRKMMKAAGAIELIGDEAIPGRVDLERRIEALGWELRWFEKLEDEVQPELKSLLAVHRYVSAEARLEDFARLIQDPESPARRQVRVLLGTIREASASEFEKIEQKRRLAVATTFEELLDQAQANVDLLKREFTPAPDVRIARDDTRRIAAALDAIQRRLLDLEARYTAKALEPRLASFAFREIQGAFESERQDLLKLVQALWQPLEAEGLGRATAVEHLIEQRLTAMDVTLEAAVAARWEEVRQGVRELAVAGNHDEALAELRRVLNALDAGGFRVLRTKASDLADEIRTQVTLDKERAGRDYSAILRDARQLLRRGRPDMLRARVQEALASTNASWPYRSDLEAILRLAEAQDRLLGRALDHLERAVGGRPLQGVLLRDGSEERRWFVTAVDPERRVIQVATTRSGPGQERELAEVAPLQITDWAQPPDGTLPPLQRAVALLMALGDLEGADLRPRLGRFVRLLEALREAQESGALMEWALRQWEDVEGRQRHREDEARAELQSAEFYLRRREYENAYFYLGRLLRDGSPLQFTTAFRDREQDIRESMQVVESELENLELAGRFPGARIAAQGKVTRLHLDFESDAQLEIFRTGDAQAWGVFETYVTPRVTTPGTGDSRFHLLRGMEGLVRDRPMAFPCIFDPAEPIKVEFELHTLQSPFLLIVDVDGVQVGILSADPLAAAYRQLWRLPPDAPLLKDESEAPPIDWTGRGRGVAFHAGKGFGDVTDREAWKWPRAGEGRNFEAWADSKRKKAELFAFEARQVYRVEVLRERGRITLSVDGEVVASQEDASWARIGRKSDREKRIRGGTGLIQILTWTPQAIDDLKLSGVVLERWR